MTSLHSPADRPLGAAADVAAELGTDTESGLDPTEAAHRLAVEGSKNVAREADQARVVGKHAPLQTASLRAIGFAVGAR